MLVVFEPIAISGRTSLGSLLARAAFRRLVASNLTCAFGLFKGRRNGGGGPNFGVPPTKFIFFGRLLIKSLSEVRARLDFAYVCACEKNADETEVGYGTGAGCGSGGVEFSLSSLWSSSMCLL